MKKVSYVVSMLLVAFSTAGAMAVGQSYAASGTAAQDTCAKGNAVTTIDYDALTPEQFEALQLDRSGG